MRYRTSTRAILVVSVVTLSTLSVQAQGPVAGDGNAIGDTPHITIVGTARAAIPPDLATITLGVVTEKPTAREAAETNARAAQAIIAAGRAQGVAGADLATETVTLTQTFDDLHDAAGRFTGRKSRGFSATNMFVVRVRDLSKAGAIAQALIEAGATRFDGIGFSIEHPEPVLERLSAEAVKNARREAQLVTEAAGVKLGPILLIEHANERNAPAPLYRQMKAAAAAPMPIEAGTNELTSSLEVTWALGR